MIIADSREPQSLLKKMKAKFGDEMKVDTLAWGDYIVIGDRMKVVIERKSVVGDTILPIYVDGKVGLYTMEEIYEMAYNGKTEMYALSFNTQLKKLAWKRIKAVYRHWTDEVYVVKNDGVKNLGMSEKHNVWKIYLSNRTRLVPTEELNVGDFLLYPTYVPKINRFTYVQAYDIGKRDGKNMKISSEAFEMDRIRLGYYLQGIINVLFEECVDENALPCYMARIEDKKFLFGLNLLMSGFEIKRMVREDVDGKYILNIWLKGEERDKIYPKKSKKQGLRISEIKVEKYEGYLYDISVDKYENFVGGEVYPVLLHNTAFDLIASVNDRRLWRQIDGMRNYGDDWETVVLIEGNKWRVIKSGRVTYPRWIGIISSLINIPKLKLLFVDDRDETIDILANLNKRAGKMPKEISFNNMKKGGRSEEEEARDVLLSFSGVGVVKAKGMMENEKSLYDMFKQTKKKLMEKYGKIGEHIWNILHYEFGGDKNE